MSLIKETKTKEFRLRSIETTLIRCVPYPINSGRERN